MAKAIRFVVGNADEGAYDKAMKLVPWEAGVAEDIIPVSGGPQ